MGETVALRVAVIGSAGRLGAFARELLGEAAGFELVGAYDAGAPWERAVANDGAQVALEATRAGLGAAHGLALLAAGVRPVIATSGVTLEQQRQLDGRARELGLGGLVVPNLSLGALLLERACRLIAPHLPAIEILEEHHQRKVDAPSGTALELARAIGESGSADPAAIAIRSQRLPDRYAHHQVAFGGPGERLTLRHDMEGPAAFAPGILACLRYAAAARGVARGLAAALDPGAEAPDDRASPECR